MVLCVVEVMVLVYMVSMMTKEKAKFIMSIINLEED